MNQQEETIDEKIARITAAARAEAADVIRDTKERILRDVEGLRKLGEKMPDMGFSPDDRNVDRELRDMFVAGILVYHNFSEFSKVIQDAKHRESKLLLYAWTKEQMKYMGITDIPEDHLDEDGRYCLSEAQAAAIVEAVDCISGTRAKSDSSPVDYLCPGMDYARRLTGADKYYASDLAKKHRKIYNEHLKSLSDDDRKTLESELKPKIVGQQGIHRKHLPLKDEVTLMPPRRLVHSTTGKRVRIPRPITFTDHDTVNGVQLITEPRSLRFVCAVIMLDNFIAGRSLNAFSPIGTSKPLPMKSEMVWSFFGFMARCDVFAEYDYNRLTGDLREDVVSDPVKLRRLARLFVQAISNDELKECRAKADIRHGEEKKMAYSWAYNLGYHKLGRIPPDERIMVSSASYEVYCLGTAAAKQAIQSIGLSLDDATFETIFSDANWRKLLDIVPGLDKPLSAVVELPTVGACAESKRKRAVKVKVESHWPMPEFVSRFVFSILKLEFRWLHYEEEAEEAKKATQAGKAGHKSTRLKEAQLNG